MVNNKNNKKASEENKSTTNLDNGSNFFANKNQVRADKEFRFVISPIHRAIFERRMRSTLVALQQMNIKYYVTESPYMLTPVMYDERHTAYAGLLEIQETLEKILLTPQKTN